MGKHKDLTFMIARGLMLRGGNFWKKKKNDAELKRRTEEICSALDELAYTYEEDSSDPCYGELKVNSRGAGCDAYITLLACAPPTPMGLAIASNTLKRLLENQPLNEIVDTDDIWEFSENMASEKGAIYRCTRMHSLFKLVHEDGKVTYNDTDRVRYNITNDKGNDVLTVNKVFDDIMEEYFPITMPYTPRPYSYELAAKVFLYHTNKEEPSGGIFNTREYDTIAVLYISDTDGKKVHVNRYFAKNEGGDFEEISSDEYNKRAVCVLLRGCYETA